MIVRGLRRRIFRQLIQIRRWNTGVFQERFVQDNGKCASKPHAKPSGGQFAVLPYK